METTSIERAITNPDDFGKMEANYRHGRCAGCTNKVDMGDDEIAVGCNGTVRCDVCDYFFCAECVAEDPEATPDGFECRSCAKRCPCGNTKTDEDPGFEELCQPCWDACRRADIQRSETARIVRESRAYRFSVTEGGQRRETTGAQLIDDNADHPEAKEIRIFVERAYVNHATNFGGAGLPIITIKRLA